MTVTTSLAYVRYTGNSAATNFAYPFKVLDADHLTVTRIVVATGVGTLVDPSNYTVNGIGAAGGGSVDYQYLGAPLTSSFYLDIEREVPLTQLLDIENQGGFLPEVIEEQFDLMTMQIQQLHQLVETAIDEAAITVIAGDGTEMTVNGAVLTGGDLDDADPAAPAGGLNVLWQRNTTPTPDSVSAYVKYGAGMGLASSALVPVMPRAAKTGAYSVVIGDRAKVIEIGTNAVTLTLLAAATAGDGFYFYTYNGNTTIANLLTIDPNGAETIDGSATVADYPGTLRVVYTDGASWYSKILLGGRATVSPAAIAADTNDYAPTITMNDTVLRISASAAYEVTGLTGGAVNQVRLLANIGTFDILLKNESASSTAANRFSLGGRSFILSPGKSIELWYDTTSSRWRPRTMPDRKVIVPLATDVANAEAVANTITDVTGLSFSVVAGQAYKFKFVIVYDAAAGTTGSRWSINGPAITDLAYRSSYTLTATTETLNSGLAAYDLPAAASASSTTTDNLAIIEGTIIPSADGTVIARFASEVSASAITAQALFSYVEYEAL